MKRLLVGGLTVAVTALAIFVWRGRGNAPEVRFTGVISGSETPVVAELGGRVVALRASVGERVSKDQVVAVLATGEGDARVPKKRSAAEQITARLEEERERIRIETERVESRIDEATAKLRGLEKEQALARADVDLARSELARVKEIFGQGLIPRQQVNQQEALVAASESKLKSAEDKVRAARADVERERAGERKVRVMQQELQQTAAQAAQARYELEQVTMTLDGTDLRAPVAGIVAAHKAREGDFVSPGAAVMSILDPTDVWVRTEVEDALSRRLVKGQPLRVILASGQEVDGKVIFLSPGAGGKVEIKVALVNPDAGIQPGMTASVVVPESPGGLAAQEPVVPRAADAEKETSPTETIAEPGADAPPAGAAPAASDEKPAIAKPAPVVATDETKQAAPAPSKPSGPGPRPSRASAPEPVLPDKSGGARAASNKSPAISKPASDTATDETKQAPLTPSNPRSPEPRQAGAGAPRPSGPNGGAPSPSSREPAAPIPERSEPSQAPAPTVEELLESIDLENPTEEELRQLEALMLHEAAAGAPEFVLEGISVAEGRPVAVINGARVFEGDSVDGARVILIMGATVQLAFEGRTITLQF
jgi:multidrug resistance efflux pump